MYARLSVVTSLIVLSVILSYYFLDREIVYFFDALNTRQYKILDYIAEIPGIVLSLVPIVILYLGLKLIANKITVLDNRLYIISLALSISFTIREILKIIFGRSWPSTFYNNPSLLSDNMYSFNCLSFNHLYKSFPSGHMIAMCSIAVVLSILYPQKNMYGGLSQLLLEYAN
ncbi:hypothetical protein NOVO_06560 [Rickettsiales bacterium Ac37b]|nr:hypothetical protein NOVO_06560 [Rickettsiales bacterium Ac37b]